MLDRQQPWPDDPLPPTLGAVELAERTLVRRIAERSLPAFDALYRGYHARLARFLERVTLRAAPVDELINDTMLVVWNRAATYNGQCKVSTWVFAIAYRKALKALKGIDPPVADEGAHLRASDEAGPEEQREQR